MQPFTGKSFYRRVTSGQECCALGVTNRYPMFYDRMFRTAIYQKAPSQIAMVPWKWVPVLGSQTSHRACHRVTRQIKGYGFKFVAFLYLNDTTFRNYSYLCSGINNNKLKTRDYV